MNGVLIINKKENVTSRDVVNDIVHIFNTKKVGHTGTLDPIATGVLVVTIGKCTKLNELLTSEEKEYVAEFLIGKSTDTLDITGKILKEENVELDEDIIRNTINSFQKTYMQEVPIYSAVKVNGKKLYEYARNNENVELPKKEVTIKEIEVLDISNNKIKFRCLVSKGTYIRSLIRDIGDELNVPTVMTSLVRTKQGKFSIEESISIENVKNNKYKLLNIEDVLDVEVIDMSDELYKKVSNGSKLPLDMFDGNFILFKYMGNDVALYQRKDMYRIIMKLED